VKRRMRCDHHDVSSRVRHLFKDKDGHVELVTIPVDVSCFLTLLYFRRTTDVLLILCFIIEKISYTRNKLPAYKDVTEEVFFKNKKLFLRKQ
jgi:hypothetical protein